MSAVQDHRTCLVVALAFALCLIAGSAPRIIGDGGEYLAQALNFAALNPPSFGRQTIPQIERRLAETVPDLSAWSIERTSVAGHDRRRDFLHFWFYALLTTPLVWITHAVGVSPLHAFTALNLVLLAIALHLALPRAGITVTVLLFASPLVWWLDKAHTEVFTVTLLTIALLTMRDRPWWAMVAAGAAATQNPPITAVLLLIGLAVLAERRLAALWDRRIVAGAGVGLALAALPPVYTYVRHGTPSLLLYATRPGFPTAAELSASVLDPSMGLIGNFPVFLVATIGVGVWLAARHPRLLLTSETAVATASAAVFLYAFAQTSNPHHGGTPSMTRYALWFIPLSLAVWVPWRRVAGPRGRNVMRVAAAVSAFASIVAFHPGVPSNAHEPTPLAIWLWTHHPRWHHPLPEVFTETLFHAERTSVPVAAPGCAKILLAARHNAPAWPVPCLPAPVPAFCLTPETLCYANRRGGNYTFTRAPGRKVAFTHDDADAWPVATEPHVRQVFLDADWPALVTRPASALTILRAAHNLRVAGFGDDARALFVVRTAGPEPFLQIRSARAMRGQLIDASTGHALASLAFDGSADDVWTVPVPQVTGGIMLMTLHQHSGETAP